ncbi:MAG: hypothetical protein GY854_24150 [Deltaproteobacteria bacterium]|nr:hypothetical protein [Deltaproteobacteria bacterium]
MYAFIFIAIVFGIVAAIVAFNKGRNSLGWFLGGLLIGPFALIVAVLPPVPRSGQYLKCPSCAEIVQADANICRFCSGDLTEVAENAS